jgi:aquaporin Z
MAMIYAFAETSGAHFNPAVSIAFAFAKKFSWKEVPIYIIAQILGALVASLILCFLFPTSETLGATIATVDVWRAFVLELLLTFFLMVVIINVSTGSKEIGVVAGIAIGGVVLLEAMFAGPITNASMNPARSIAPAIVSGNLQHLWMYITAPILGALLAVVSCKLVKDENCCNNEEC